MEMTSTRTVIVDGKARDYPLGTPYQAIAADAQEIGRASCRERV